MTSFLKIEKKEKSFFFPFPTLYVLSIFPFLLSFWHLLNFELLLFSLICIYITNLTWEAEKEKALHTREGKDACILQLVVDAYI